MRVDLKRSTEPHFEQQLDQFLQDGEFAAYQWSADNQYVHSPIHRLETLD